MSCGESGLVPLADGLLAEECEHSPVRRNLNPRGLVGGRARGVQVHAEAEAAQSTPTPACLAACLEGLPAGLVKRRVHGPRKVTAVPDLTVRCTVGHLLRA